MEKVGRRKAGVRGNTLAPMPLAYRPRRRLEAAVKRFSISSLDLKATQARIIFSLQRSSSEKKLLGPPPVKKPACPTISITELSTDNKQFKPCHNRSSSTLLPIVPFPSLKFCESQEPPTVSIVDRKERSRKALTAFKHFKQLNLPVNTIYRLKQYVPVEPFTDKHSLRFLMACRLGETDKVLKLLMGNRWLVLEFDKVKKTGLHWAARRNHVEIVENLLKSGAFIDARDCIGRTPLYLASRASHLPSVRLLLSHKANPFLKTTNQKSALSASCDAMVQQLLTRAMQLHILLKFAEASKRRSVWQQEGLTYFANSHPLQP
jgi:hypothetical protein